jgi:hypothetical protein
MVGFLFWKILLEEGEEPFGAPLKVTRLSRSC